MIVVITVVVFGGSTTVMLERLRIATQVHEEPEGDELLNLPARADRVHWFVALDRRYLKKFFRSAHPPSRMSQAAMQAMHGGEIERTGLSGGAMLTGRHDGGDHGNDDEDSDVDSTDVVLEMTAMGSGDSALRLSSTDLADGALIADGDHATADTSVAEWNYNEAAKVLQ